MNFEGMNYESFSVPPEYSQWGIPIKQYEKTGKPRGEFWFFEDDFSGENVAILEKEIDKWIQIPDLTVIDKVVLVANYL